jgi:hypothetical protein
MYLFYIFTPTGLHIHIYSPTIHDISPTTQHNFSIHHKESFNIVNYLTKYNIIVLDSKCRLIEINR